ncbi:hypothetical protein K2173_018227 [Erythroxylum novogranatense]|uniref:Uncharacterized protein n=1 Tax=Erythroxylum novogranatense TaxID=1862640 RepID=A0AAV8TP36_9ROSI|nr:hypothetical protein K2173_018227 [Erythroxylum novogranatense]
MLMLEEIDTNSIQRYTSLQEVIKQTIIEQEFIFRNQVHELHRLYRLQKSLMKDLGFQDCIRYSSWTAKVQSSLPPIPFSMTCKSHAKEVNILSISKGDHSRSGSCELLEDFQSAHHRLLQKPLDLQLSADDFINHAEEHKAIKGNAKKPLSIVVPSTPAGLKLSLNITDDNQRLIDSSGVLLDKETPSFSPDMIDLEASVGLKSEGHLRHRQYLGSATSELHPKSKFDSEVRVFPDPIISLSAKKYPPYDIAESCSSKQYGQFCPGQTPSTDGIKQYKNDASNNNSLTKLLQLIPHHGSHLDLNKVYIDESACYPDDHTVAYFPTASPADSSATHFDSIKERRAPAISGKQEVNIYNTHVLCEGSVENLALVDLKSPNKCIDISSRISECNEISDNIGSRSGPESMSRPQLEMVGSIGHCSGDHKVEKFDLKSKTSNDTSNNLHQGSPCRRELSCEKSEVDDNVLSFNDKFQNKLQEQEGTKSPVSCKSCISDNDSSNVKTAPSYIRCSRITSEVPNESSKSQFGCHLTEVSLCELGQAISDSFDLKTNLSDKKEESAEVNDLIQIAAESLIHMSSEISVCFHDSHTNIGFKEAENEKMERPQNSSDTFELMTLNLAESNMMDDSASSNAFEVNDTAMKDFGLKLRRGRRMKDFQREILPALVSLSADEILEDISILEGVLRSREYRQMRAKMGVREDNRFSLVKNRRSRLNSVRRRYGSGKFS